MTVKDLFRKEFLFESKKEKHPFKIFYKIDIFLKKNQAEQPTPPEEQQPAQPTPPEAAPVASPEMTPEVPSPTEVTPQDIPQVTPQEPEVMPNPSYSVVTEDDEEDKEEVTDDNVIVRKLNGEIELSQEDVNNIQSIDDIYQKLQEEKDNGTNILDELSFELLQNLTQTNQLQQELKDKVDIKESNIFAEIIYGKKLDESVGVRLIKRKSSELVTNSMLVNNQIVNSQFSKEKLDSKIVDMRNEEYSDEK